jgi:hypothetical protein
LEDVSSRQKKFEEGRKFPIPKILPPNGEKRKKLIFILLLIGFFWQNKKKHIYAVVNWFQFFVGLVCFGRSLALNDGRPVLNDAFSSL